jgi:hypothetical protein
MYLFKATIKWLNITVNCFTKIFGLSKYGGKNETYFLTSCSVISLSVLAVQICQMSQQTLNVWSLQA